MGHLTFGLVCGKAGMSRTLVSCLAFLALISINVIAAAPLRISAVPVEQHLRNYFLHPNMSNADVLATYISTKEVADFADMDAGMRVSDLIEVYTDKLKKMVMKKKGHAIKVALLLQCIYYDHHVYNDISLTLGDLATSDLPLLLRHAKELDMSPSLMARIVSCEGICGPDEDVCEKLRAKLKSIESYCQKNRSVYCTPMIADIKDGLGEYCTTN